MASGRDRCIVCRTIVHADDQFVLVVGRRRQVHCSEDCLGTTMKKRRAVRRRLIWRGIAGASVVAVVLGVFLTIKSHRKPVQRSIALPWAEPQVKKAPPPLGPNYYGPAWPPTDEDWQFAFEQVRWLYPLPGPVRREPTVHDRMLAPEPPKPPPGKSAKVRPPEPYCRQPGTCGVTLGGELWGEHVYAVQAGVVDYARATGSDEGGGGYVRIAHFGGMVFSHYYHLAAIPKGIARGARIAPGDVVGLLGDTGTGVEGKAPRSHLHFAFSIHPSVELPDVYWDPTPLMAKWPLKVPPHGTVAGLTSTMRDEEAMRKHRIR